MLDKGMTDGDFTRRPPSEELIRDGGGGASIRRGILDSTVAKGDSASVSRTVGGVDSGTDDTVEFEMGPVDGGSIVYYARIDGTLRAIAVECP